MFKTNWCLFQIKMKNIHYKTTKILAAGLWNGIPVPPYCVQLGGTIVTVITADTLKTACNEF